MKRQQIVKRMIGFAAAALACAAILVGNPAALSPVPNGIGQETGDGTGESIRTGMENPKGMGGGAEISPQSDDEKETEVMNIK